jgi:hypothetical protein
MSYPNEPSPMGRRDLVVTEIATCQIGRISSLQHLTHPPTFDDESTGTTSLQQQSVENVLLHPLHKKIDQGLTNGFFEKCYKARPTAYLAK